MWGPYSECLLRFLDFGSSLLRKLKVDETKGKKQMHGQKISYKQKKKCRKFLKYDPQERK